MELRNSFDATHSSGIVCFVLLTDSLVSLSETTWSLCETRRVYRVETPFDVSRETNPFCSSQFNFLHTVALER